MPGWWSLRNALWSATAVALLACVHAGNSAGAAILQPSGDRPVLYVGGGAAEVGGLLGSEIVVLMGAKSGMDEFEITIAYDPELASVRRVTLDSQWLQVESRARLSSAGQLTLSAVHSEDGCVAGASCHLATIEWAGQAEGMAMLAVEGASLLLGGVSIPDVGTVPGRLQVGPASTTAAPAATTGAVVAGVRTPGLETPATGSPRPASGLDSSLAASLVLLVGIVVALIVGGTLVIAVARRSWAWSRRRPLSEEANSGPFTGDASTISDEVGEFLYRIEALGRVSGEEGSDLATDVAAAFARGGAANGAGPRPPGDS